MRQILRKDSIYGSIDKYFLLNDKSNKAVNELTQNLDDYFSSPILKDDIYYGISFYNMSSKLKLRVGLEGYVYINKLT